jgi:ubiquinone/menaquinone biosynthesis C-methylase UbiE
MSELHYQDTAAAGYDEGVGTMTRLIVPKLMRLAELAYGHQVLDLAAGTGLASEAAALAVGPTGHVVAADVSPPMLEQAKIRLVSTRNATIRVEDAHNLSWTGEIFDRVICNMGLMYFSDPARGLSEMYRVLRQGGRIAVSVFGSRDRPFLGTVFMAIDEIASAKTGMGEQLHALGEDGKLRGLLEAVGFRDVQTESDILHLHYPSFDAYFAGVDRGAGSAGQAYMALPPDQRQLVRTKVQRRVRDSGGALDVEVEIALSSGKK